ncbi:MAG: phosphoribosylformylglycinamidine synthase subunit PurL [Candidatus Promineifilaceae bacterium]
MSDLSSTQLTTSSVVVRSRQLSGDTPHLFITAAKQLGIEQLQGCIEQKLYFLHGNLATSELSRLTQQLLADPVTETADLSGATPEETFVDVTWLAGVTDPSAENLVKAAHTLGYTALEQAMSGTRFILSGALSSADVEKLASTLLCNPVVQQYSVDRPIRPTFISNQPPNNQVDIIPLLDANNDALLAISKERRLSLDLAEMQAIQAYFKKAQREPNEIELETLAQTWSEHCVHKTFRAHINFDGPDGRKQVKGILNTHIRAATDAINKPWVQSAFVDNAGIVTFDDNFDLAFKVETHNHPSALEPFGGANTGVGGCIRDVIGVSARPIANTDILCFGLPDADSDSLPEGVLHPSRIADGVIAGVEDYGNKMGIPTVNGSIVYDPGYTANPLVYVGCLGILPHGSHPTEIRPNDLIVALGGRTGRDGLRGATFSSMEMDVNTSEIAGTAVQIGHPIQEKQVLEVILRTRDEKLYTAITDCGAGGFSSAVGEMGEKIGATVQLASAPLKYAGLRPWEIWLSEAQERIVIAVPEENWPRVQEIAIGQDVEAFVLGRFEPTGHLKIYNEDELVGDLAMSFLHDGIPLRHLDAVWKAPAGAEEAVDRSIDPEKALFDLLAHPNIRSKESIVRRYDHEVQGATAVKPFVGVANHGPSDAAVLVPQDTVAVNVNAQAAVALGNGICPEIGKVDPYSMAWAAIDEAVRNIVAVGADPDRTAILDNFCWGNPNLPDRLGALVRCTEGCYDAAVAYGTPFISGKDSLNNEYTGADGKKHAIPSTLLISAMGHVPEVSRAVTMDLKMAGNQLYMVGNTHDELGGSHLHLLNHVAGGTAPQPKTEALETFRQMHQAIQMGLVQACHDCSEGGLAVASAEMSIAGRLGLNINLSRLPNTNELDDISLLYSESLSRFLVEVRSEDAADFEMLLGDVPHRIIGQVTNESVLRVQSQSGATLIETSIAQLETAWRSEVAVAHSVGVEEGVSAEFNIQKRGDGSKKVIILHANGTNRDHDVSLACELAGGATEIVHINQLLNGERQLGDYHMLVVPGGFSYGDDLGAGVLWSTYLQHRLGDDLQTFVASGRPVLGICNGFQTLVKAGLLSGEIDPATRSTTLTYNAGNQFECRWVYLEPNANSNSLFLQGLTEPIYCPVAHGEGRFAVRDDATLANLRDQNLIALSYQQPDTNSPSYPFNPNGSILDIAGISNAAGNVLGLMPHPENHIFPWQHPRWRRGESGLLGLRLFENGLRHA